MPELDLLRALPRSKRNITARQTAKTPELIALSRQYGREYFDGPRDVGYGGYRYDGRWVPVARDIIAQYGLKPGDRVLDIGCAKGFLVKDLVAQGIDAYGVDVSEYAMMNCEPEIVGRLSIAASERLLFPDQSFDVVLAINSLHNLKKPELIQALREMERLARKGKFLQVDSYRTPEEKEVFESWVLTAHTYGYPSEWEAIFNEAEYTGDYYWTFINGE
ncbi:MAG: class I SAM-dependent methyltransferase [Rhodospirillaceae bacterium]